MRRTYTPILIRAQRIGEEDRWTGPSQGSRDAAIRTLREMAEGQAGVRGARILAAGGEELIPLREILTS